jgi:hypothetical protein
MWSAFRDTASSTGKGAESLPEAGLDPDVTDIMGMSMPKNMMEMYYILETLTDGLVSIHEGIALCDNNDFLESKGTAKMVDGMMHAGIFGAESVKDISNVILELGPEYFGRYSVLEEEVEFAILAIKLGEMSRVHKRLRQACDQLRANHENSLARKETYDSYMRSMIDAGYALRKALDMMKSDERYQEYALRRKESKEFEEGGGSSALLMSNPSGNLKALHHGAKE